MANTRRMAAIAETSRSARTGSQAVRGSEQEEDTNSSTGNVRGVEGNQQGQPNLENVPGLHQMMMQMVGLAQQQHIMNNHISMLLSQQQEQFQNHQIKQRSGFMEFKRLNPPSFEGSIDPLEAEKWVQEIEKVFKVLKCLEEDKVTYATHMLQGLAQNWWVTQQQIYEENREACTWERFVKDFYEHYFPKSVRRQKEQEFIKLKQGNTTVAEYEAEFSKLAKFAPKLVSDQESRARRFEKGLNPQIYQIVSAFELETYAEVLSKALVVERGMVQNEVASNNGQKKRPRPSEFQGGQVLESQTKGFRNQNFGGNFQQGGAPWCRRCERYHSEADCRWLSGACFNCGKKGHKIANCPTMGEQQGTKMTQEAIGNKAQTENQRNGRGQKPMNQGRFYALTQQDAQDSNAVVRGIPFTSSSCPHTI
jgi:hypothetical protein